MGQFQSAETLAGKSRLSLKQLGLFGGLTAAVGVIVVVATLAAGTPIAFEPESGTLANGATVASVSGQSGSGAVKFGAGSTGDLDLQRIPWEGGPAYYAQFAKANASGWDEPHSPKSSFVRIGP